MRTLKKKIQDIKEKIPEAKYKKNFQTRKHTHVFFFPPVGLIAPSINGNKYKPMFHIKSLRLFKKKKKSIIITSMYCILQVSNFLEKTV